jgi:hypothetical protein
MFFLERARLRKQWKEQNTMDVSKMMRRRWWDNDFLTDEEMQYLGRQN